MDQAFNSTPKNFTPDFEKLNRLNARNLLSFMPHCLCFCSLDSLENSDFDDNRDLLHDPHIMSNYGKITMFCIWIV
ncbi:hypothetical protein KIN20_005934 [Parelaphostrongylus tenuis]|uniref:Uncharacterized protein n=1 Tax=Parelaphostrongylus tenuis TaxID=148309 RepID=A0AAD5QJ01_PARTN|nr:hypothetical protein KIN20_005934 [Parelaphostrongylus tenuis]